MDPVKENTNRIPIKNYNSTVSLHESRSRLRNISCTTAIISKYHILEGENTSNEICNKILNTDIGLGDHYRNINFSNVIPVLSPILKCFKNRHIRYNYLDKLKLIILKDSIKYVNKKFHKQIHIHSMRTYFSSLLYENVPLKLFGTRKNFKAIKKTVYHLLNTTPGLIMTRRFKRNIKKKKVTGASLNIQPLLEKLDISKIEWLNSINDNKIQWVTILKLLHWFFTQYIIKILHKYIVVKSVKISNKKSDKKRIKKLIKKQWVYFLKEDWCQMQQEFLQEKENRDDLVELSLKEVEAVESKRMLSIGKYMYIPSTSGLRVILRVKYNNEEKCNANVARRFLQQLYLTQFNKLELPNYRRCLEEIFKFKMRKNLNRLYYVRCDIQDAFGSIIQDKLNDIITAYCRQLPTDLSVRRYKLDKTRKKLVKEEIKLDKTRKKLDKEEIFQVLGMKQCIRKEFTMIDEKPKTVKMKKLISKIRKFIFGHRVQVNGKIYWIRFGVPQGVTVSSILSDIYYEHMFQEVFSAYKKNGFLCTYVDDILYMTEDECYAAQFLEMIKNGIPEYNVKFNPRKIQSNANLPYKSTKVKFLGEYIKF